MAIEINPLIIIIPLAIAVIVNFLFYLRERKSPQASKIFLIGILIGSISICGIMFMVPGLAQSQLNESTNESSQPIVTVVSTYAISKPFTAETTILPTPTSTQITLTPIKTPTTNPTPNQIFPENFANSEAIRTRIDRLSINKLPKNQYKFGENVSLSGKNEESDTTYLFIIGEGLNPKGANLNNPENEVNSGAATNFVKVPVDTNKNWKYSWSGWNSSWNISRIPLSKYYYSIYAVSNPLDYYSVSNASYAVYKIRINADDSGDSDTEGQI